MADHNVRGRKANKEQRAVDAPARFVQAPEHLSPDVADIFNACVRRMPAGFFTPAHVYALAALAGEIKIVQDLEREVHAPDFEYLVTGSTGNQIQNPLLRALAEHKGQLMKWIAVCKLGPNSTYPSDRAVPHVTEDDVAAEESDDPRVKRLRSIV